MSTIVLILLVGLVGLIAGGLGAYAGAMIAAGTIAIKLSEMTTRDGRTAAKITDSIN